MTSTGPIRDQPSESSASPQASSTTPQSSPMSCQKPRSSLSPAPVYINKENLTAPATNSQIASLGEQLNILIALSEETTVPLAEEDHPLAEEGDRGPRGGCHEAQCAHRRLEF